jgi:hypothetical protein
MLVVAKTFTKNPSIITLESRNCRLLEKEQVTEEKGNARGAEAPVANAILVAGTLSGKWGPPVPTWHLATGF